MPEAGSAHPLPIKGTDEDDAFDSIGSRYRRTDGEKRRYRRRVRRWFKREDGKEEPQ
jgi:hypothetical protein